MSKGSIVGLAVVNAVVFVGMVVVNGLANALPLNGMGTGEISDLYPNLFVPAGLTFSIWGLIYLLLLGFSGYGLVRAIRGGEGAESLRRVGPFFALSSLANIGWIVAWHWRQLPLSLALMLVILGSLVAVYLRLGIGRRVVGRGERLLVHLPFSVYLGWITVATIANVTALLVSVGWDGFGLSEATWAVTMILAAAAITVAVIATRRDLAYALVVTWALLGIALKRSSDLAEPAPAVGTTALVAAVALAILALLWRVAFRPRPSSA